MTTWTKETVNLAIAGDSLTVDNIKIDGTNIGHTSDTDLLALSSGALTINGDLTIAGNTLTFGNSEVIHNEANDHMYIRTKNLIIDSVTSDGSGASLVAAMSSANYDSKFALYEGADIKWSMGQDYSDSAKLKFDYSNAAVGGATKLTLDSSGNMTVAGDLSVTGGITSGTSSNVHSIHVSDGSTSSMNMGNEAEIVITDDGIPRIYFEDTGEGTNDKLMAIANYHENFVVQSLVDDGESYDVESILVCNRDGRVGIGTRTFDSNVVNYLTILNGTEPSAHTDNQIYIGSKDATTTSEATLSLFCEEDPETSTTWNMSQRMKVWINGTEYWIALDAV